MTENNQPALPPQPRSRSPVRWILLGFTALVLVASTAFSGWARQRGWKAFTAENSEIGHINVNIMAIDSQDQVWVGTNDGLGVLTTNGGWRRYTPANSALPNAVIISLAVDNYDRVWVGTYGDVLSVLLPDGSLHVLQPEKPGPADDIPSLAVDDQGRVWVGTWGTGLKVRSPAGKWRTYTTDNSGLLDNDIQAQAIDSQGRVWVGTRTGGLSVLYPDNLWRVYTQGNSELLDNRINYYALAIDSADRVWVGTKGGLCALSPVGVWQTYTTSNSGLPQQDVLALAIDSQDRVWVGDHGGVSVLSPDGSWHRYTDPNLEPVQRSMVVEALAIDSQDHVWMGTMAGLSVLDERAVLPAGMMLTLRVLGYVSLGALILQVTFIGVRFLMDRARRVKAARDTARNKAPETQPWMDAKRSDAARRSAQKWYLWLWLSPLLTIPTLVLFLGLSPGRLLLCPGSTLGCEWSDTSRISVLVSVLGSCLWHLVLLKPASSRDRFVRWHGRQALLLAGIRTAIPLIFGLLYLETIPALWFIPFNIIAWLAGNLIGQHQAGRGDCWLARVFLRADDLPGRPQARPAEEVEVF